MDRFVCVRVFSANACMCLYMCARVFVTVIYRLFLKTSSVSNLLLNPISPSVRTNSLDRGREADANDKGPCRFQDVCFFFSTPLACKARFTHERFTNRIYEAQLLGTIFLLFSLLFSLCLLRKPLRSACPVRLNRNTTHILSTRSDVSCE